MVIKQSLKTKLNEKTVGRRKALAGESRVGSAIERHGRNDLTPSLNIRAWAIADLKTARRRSRKTSSKQLDRVRLSIARFGIVVPVIVTGTGEIIDGHIIVEAARSLGITHVPAAMMEHLSEAECRLLRLSLNRIAEAGEWDIEELRWELDELSLAGEDLSVTGFEPMELDIIRTQPVEQRSPKAKRDKKPPEQPVTRVGDTWLLGPHCVHCGDSLLARAMRRYCGAGRRTLFSRIRHITAQSQVLLAAWASTSMTISRWRSGR